MSRTLMQEVQAFIDEVPHWYLDGEDPDPLAYCLLRLAEDFGIVLAGVGITQLRKAIQKWEQL